MMDLKSKIYVAGGETLIGSAILYELEQRGYENLIGRPGEEADLTDPVEVERFFFWASPEYVFLAAGRSGGIQANQDCPASLMRENLLAECNVVHQAYRHGVKKLLYLASTCSYPKQCPQPMREDLLLTGALEPTSEAYALAKIAGIKLCQAYRRQYGAQFVIGIPANVFGPRDDFSEENSRVIPGLIRRMHKAKQERAESVILWGSGSPRRDFIFSRDLADACLLVMNEYEDAQPINLGAGSDLSIAELASIIKEVTGFQGNLIFDTGRPDGMPRRLLDSSKLGNLGWSPSTPLRDGLHVTYEWFLQLTRKRSHRSGENRLYREETC
jgi:GDP-L-fucose synthase